MRIDEPPTDRQVIVIALLAAGLAAGLAVATAAVMWLLGA